jgi:hypothetical protein
MLVRFAPPFLAAAAAALVLGACSPGGSSGDRGTADAGDAASPSAGATAERPATTEPTTEDAPEDELRVTTFGWSTDFSRHEVPLGEFIGGGPGKDGIPAIDEPKFQPISDVDWLEDQEPVIAVGIDEQWRAYPIQILVWHEIVNDNLAGQPITVTFCPLCHTGITFNRELDGQTFDFGVTGNLRHSDLVMYDRQTETWWQQATGQAVVGELSGKQLEILPSQLMSWEQFRTLHPAGEVLSRETGHSRPYGDNPYAGYDSVDTNPFLLDDFSLIDGRLSPKVRVVGVIVGDDAAAYPFPDLAEAGVVNDEVADTPLVVLWAPGTASGLGASTVAGGELVGAAAVYDRRTDEGTLTFEPAGDGLMTDAETDSTWSFDGVATDGPMRGARLDPIPNDQPFWFAWGIFQPDARIWQP